MAAPAPTTFAPSPKQIVFLVMAATLVAVIVFLGGVLVGRGVPLEPVRAGRLLAGGADGDRFRPDPSERPPLSNTPGREPSAAAVAGDDLIYNRWLDGAVPADTGGRLEMSDRSAVRPGGAAPRPMPDGAAAAAADAPAAGAVTPAPRAAPPAAPTPVDAVRPDRPGSGFTVQVSALRERAAAERMATGLIDKGYPAFVADPYADAPVSVFRVRVGRYAERAEAERVLQRLEREEQLMPWITR